MERESGSYTRIYAMDGLKDIMVDVLMDIFMFMF